MQIKSITVLALLFFLLISTASCSGPKKNEVEMRMSSYINTTHRWEKSPIHTVFLSATRSKEALQRYDDLIRYLKKRTWIPQAAASNLFKSNVILYVFEDHLNVEIHSPWTASAEQVRVSTRESHLFHFSLEDTSFQNDVLFAEIEKVVLETLSLYYEEPAPEKKPSERDVKKYIKTDPRKIA